MLKIHTIALRIVNFSFSSLYYKKEIFVICTVFQSPRIMVDIIVAISKFLAVRLYKLRVTFIFFLFFIPKAISTTTVLVFFLGSITGLVV